MIELPKEIDITQAHNLKAGFQSPIEIKNNSEEGYKTKIKGVEIFTPVTEEGFEHHWISSKGRVWNSEKKRIMKNRKTKQGYRKIGIYNKNKKQKTFLVHRLVAFAFVSNPKDKVEVNHINGIKDDNRVGNLEFVTRGENMRHAWGTGLIEGYIDGDSEKIEKIIKLRKMGKTYKQIADEVGVGESTARRKCEEAGQSTGLKVARVTDEAVAIIIKLRKQEMSYREIASKTGISAATVYRKYKEAEMS